MPVESKNNQPSEASLAASSSSSSHVATQVAGLEFSNIDALINSAKLPDKHSKLVEALRKLSGKNNNKRNDVLESADLNAEIIEELFNFATKDARDLTKLKSEDYIDYDKTTEHEAEIDTRKFIIPNFAMIKIMLGPIKAQVFSSKEVSPYLSPGAAESKGGKSNFIFFYHKYSDKIDMITTEEVFSGIPKEFIADWKALMDRLYEGSTDLNINFDEETLSNKEIQDLIALLDEIDTQTEEYIGKTAAFHKSIIAKYTSDKANPKIPDDCKTDQEKYNFIQNTVLKNLANKLGIEIKVNESDPEYTTKLEQEIRNKAQDLTHQLVDKIKSLDTIKTRKEPTNESTKDNVSKIAKYFLRYYAVNRKVFSREERDCEKGYCLQERLKESPADIFTLVDDGQPNLISFAATALANNKIPFVFFKQNISPYAGPEEYAIFNTAQAEIFLELRQAFLEKNQEKFTKAMGRLKRFNELYKEYYPDLRKDDPYSAHVKCKEMAKKMKDELVPNPKAVQEAFDELPAAYKYSAQQYEKKWQPVEAQKLDTASSQRINELYISLSKKAFGEGLFGISDKTINDFKELQALGAKHSALANYYLGLLYRDGMAIDIENKKRVTDPIKAFEHLCALSDSSYDDARKSEFNSAIKGCYLDAKDLTADHCLHLAHMAEKGIGYYPNENKKDAYLLLCTALILEKNPARKEVILSELSEFQNNNDLDEISAPTPAKVRTTITEITADGHTAESLRRYASKNASGARKSLQQIYALRYQYYQKHPNTEGKDLSFNDLHQAIIENKWSDLASSAQASSSSSNLYTINALDHIFYELAQPQKINLPLNIIRSNINEHNINQQNTNGNSLLHLAASKGQLAIATYLVDNGINLQIRNNEGKQAYELALEFYDDVKNRQLILNSIVLKQAEMIKNDENRALFKSIFIDDFFIGQQGNFENNPALKVIFERLQGDDFSLDNLKALIDNQTADDPHLSKLYQLINDATSRHELNQNLIEYKFKYNLEKEGQQAVYYTSVVTSFIETGGDINIKLDNDGNTLLHFAVQNEYTGLIKGLFYRNIDFHEKNNDQKTAFEMALESENENHKLIQLFFEEIKKIKADEMTETAQLFNRIFNDRFFLDNAVLLKNSPLLKQLFFDLLDNKSLEDIKTGIQDIEPGEDEHLIALRERILSADSMKNAEHAISQYKTESGMAIFQLLERAMESSVPASSTPSSRFVEVKNADINTYPLEKYNPKGFISIGDLHGNAVKFLHFLVSHNIVEFKENQQENYAKFVELYGQMEALLEVKKFTGIPDEQLESKEILEKARENIKQFDELIQLLEVKDSKTLIHLIGDEFSDRGANDYYILKLIDLLKKNDVGLSINLSNHSNDFILFYEHLKADENPDLKSTGIVAIEQKASSARFKYLLDNEVISKSDFIDFVEHQYKPCLKAIEYTLTETGIQLYTHAPVSFNAVELLAEQLKVQYDDSTKEALANTIDRINKKIQELAATNQLKEHFPDHSKNNGKEMLNDNPLFYFTWNRWNDEQEGENSRPSQVNGYSVSYVHGHDSYLSPKEHVVNTDTANGRATSAVLMKQNEDSIDFSNLLTVTLNSISKDFTLTEMRALQLIEFSDRFLALRLHSSSAEYTKLYNEVKNFFNISGELDQHAYDDLNSIVISLAVSLREKVQRQTTRFINIPVQNEPQLEAAMAASSSSSSSSYAQILSKTKGNGAEATPVAPTVTDTERRHLLERHAVMGLIRNKFGDNPSEMPPDVSNVYLSNKSFIDRFSERNISVKTAEHTKEIEQIQKALTEIPQEVFDQYIEYKKLRDEAATNINSDFIEKYEQASTEAHKLTQKYPMLSDWVKLKPEIEKIKNTDEIEITEENSNKMG